MVRSPMEKLAREICWMGFALPEKSGTTKARYWKQISESARQNYRADAQRFVYLLENVPAAMLREIELKCIYRDEDWKLDDCGT